MALAAHLCAASVGEDTGGSGRGPAAYCGVTGLRPTYTRVSRYGMTAMCWYMDAAAPMTKRVEDCALVLGAIAGHDPKDAFTSRRPVPDYAARLRDGVKGLRFGLIKELPREPGHASRRQIGHRGVSGGVPGAGRPGEGRYPYR